ncbi:MAG: tRNA pseudouridine(55) synthase TruB [Arcanobacterium sp.]|nr:tRNA pseudouridine(55) synthase TruB [Arcanobacterium sp.]MDY5589042.1 tRNA pseudouridine(55) synthase TruB [Arcanobacterium sp.]
MTPQRNLLRQLPWGDVPRPAAGAPGSAAHPTESGILLVDKPAEVTSHDVVGAVRRLAGTRKVGHAGTLDPMATGLLTLGIGVGTKLLTYLSGHDKSYRATVRFGVATTTEDAEGELILESLGVRPDFDMAQLDAAMAQLTGDIMQRPSSVSAIKVGGERAYDRVRRGEAVELPERPVHIASFVRLSVPRASAITQMGREIAPAIDVDIEVSCSAGTYVRALARDLGELLGMGAHLTSLRRTRVGELSVDQGWAIADLAATVRAGRALPVIPLAEAAAQLLPTAHVSAKQAAALRCGQFVDIWPQPSSYPVALIEPATAGSGKRPQLVAIGKRRGKLTAPTTVFAA